MIRTKQVRRLRNCGGGWDEIRVVYEDRVADEATWCENVIMLGNERDPFRPLAAPLGMVEVCRRLSGFWG